MYVATLRLSNEVNLAINSKKRLASADESDRRRSSLLNAMSDSIENQSVGEVSLAIITTKNSNLRTIDRVNSHF